MREDPTSNPENGSSSRMRSGLCRRAAASSTFWRMPLEYDDISTCRSLCSPKQAKQSINRTGDSLSREAPQLGHHHQIFETAQMGIELRLFRHITDAALKSHQIAVDILAVE